MLLLYIWSILVTLTFSQRNKLSISSIMSTDGPNYPYSGYQGKINLNVPIILKGTGFSSDPTKLGTIISN